MNSSRFSAQRVAILPDIHFAHSGPNGVRAMDGHEPRAVSVALQMVEDFRPDWVIQLGDLGHFSYISHWNIAKGIEGRLHSQDGETMQMNLADDHALINRFWDRIQEISPRGTKYDQLEGNHEQTLRDVRQMDKYRAFSHLLYPEKQWRLQERGVRWTPYQRYTKDGVEQKNWVDVGKHLKVLHGKHAGTTHLKAHYEDMGGSCIYGHLHTRASLEFRHPEYSSRVQTIGCLASKTAVSYLKGRNNAWVHGMSFVHLLPDGKFFDEFVTILGGHSVFNGKVYTAKRERWME